MGSDFSRVRDRKWLQWERAQLSPARHPLAFPREQTEWNQSSEEQSAPNSPTRSTEAQHDLQETQDNISQSKRSQSYPLRMQPGRGAGCHTHPPSPVQVNRTVAV